MKVSKCHLEGVLIIEPKLFEDNRGVFFESFQRKRYLEFGIQDEFTQDNISQSKKNVLRGMHFNKNKPQSQLISVVNGKIYDVVVDIRKESSTFGGWFGIELSSDNKKQIYMPPGFAHGFCVLSETAHIHYKVSQEYDKDDDGGLAWDDKFIGIEWPIVDPIISMKDKKNINFEKIYA